MLKKVSFKEAEFDQAWDVLALKKEIGSFTNEETGESDNDYQTCPSNGSYKFQCKGVQSYDFNNTTDTDEEYITPKQQELVDPSKPTFQSGQCKTPVDKSHVEFN